MANSNPPVRAQAFTTDWMLEDYASPGNWKTTPTLAAGDVKVSKDGGALANIASLPSESPASSGILTVTLTGTEMTADRVTIRFIDQTSPKEWADTTIIILTTP